MTTENFIYWLKGFFEVSDSKILDQKQVQIIKDNLNLVYNKVTSNIEIQNINEVPPTFFNLQKSNNVHLPCDTLFCTKINGTIRTTDDRDSSITLDKNKSKKDDSVVKHPYTGPSGYN